MLVHVKEHTMLGAEGGGRDNAPSQATAGDDERASWSRYRSPWPLGFAKLDGCTAQGVPQFFL
eukprot:6390822-Prorocentrum_lima.AAC.1